MKDSYFIDIVVGEIEKKLGWQKITFWKDHEYKKLSQLIFEETSISLSPQTLKRFFGKIKYKDNYTIQPNTKDALARFIYYADWETFVQSHSTGIHRIPFFLAGKGSKYRKLAVVTVLLLLIAVPLLYWLQGINTKKASFKIEDKSGITPFTISLHYDISKIRGKDIYIDFDENEAEDNSGKELLDKRRTLINHCFESPGYFNVRISAGKKVLASFKIHVLSDGWASYYFDNDNFILRKFVFKLDKKIHSLESDGLLYVSPKELNDQGFNGNTVYYLEHMIYKDFHVSADSSELEVKYRNSPEIGGISCFDVEFRIICENGLASVILVQKGCYRWSEVITGEKHMYGKFHDLSPLSTDLSPWNVFRLKIENRTAIIINGNDTIFKGDYNQPLGDVKGLRLVTKGSGAFEWVRLYNSRGQLMHNDNFGN